MVAGAGRAGMAAARALAQRAGPDAVTVWDGLDGEREHAVATELLAAGIRTRHGAGTELLDGPSAPGAVIKSPGLRADEPFLRAARSRGVAVLDEAELGWRLDDRPLAGITGTNGKSTTTALVAALLAAAGLRPVTAGNSRFGVPLSAAADVPGDVVVAELSSFQLEGCPALLPEAAVLTNLTHDHRYRHGSAEAYAACKRRLLARDDAVTPVAAIGVDQPFGAHLAAELRERGARVVTFGRDPGADVAITAAEPALGGMRVTLGGPAGSRTLRSRLSGGHNALNLAGALALADGLEIDPDVALEVLAGVDPLPGRFERVGGARFDVVVDYAHNPDGIAAALDAGRAILDARGGGRLHVVLSALSLVGSEQAHAMGAAAAARADRLVLTTQRWTPDDPAGVLSPGLLDGARAAARAAIDVEPDRAAAIAAGIGGAAAGDVVLVLERGELGSPLLDDADRAVPFDDRVQARAALAAVGG